MITRSLLPFALVCVCVLLPWGCGRGTPVAKVAKDNSAAAPVPITVAAVAIRRAPRVIELVGTLEADNQVTVAAEVDGQIAAITADLGDAVAPGQVLARIDEADFRYAVDRAETSLTRALARLGLSGMPPPDFDVQRTSSVVKSKAALDEAQANLKRMKELFEQKMIAAQEFDTAETRYQTALAEHQSAVERAKALVADARLKSAQLAMARKKLKDAAIRAPISGSVSRRLAAAGDYVKAGTPLFTIVQDNPLKLRGMIPEEFAPQIRPGEPIEARVDSFPETSFMGKLVRVNPASEAASRAILVEVTIENRGRKLKPGFFAHAVVATRPDAKALAIPHQAIVTFAGVSKVYVIENGVARERMVQAGGKINDKEVEIIDGLKAGELIATSGLTGLSNGAAVKDGIGPGTETPRRP